MLKQDFQGDFMDFFLSTAKAKTVSPVGVVFFILLHMFQGRNRQKHTNKKRRVRTSWRLNLVNSSDESLNPQRGGQSGAKWGWVT